MGGNKVYTTELIKALGEFFPENDYYIITYWRRRQSCIRDVGRHSSYKFWNILPNPRILGRRLTSPVTRVNNYIQYYLSASFDLYHCTNPLSFPGKIKNIGVTIHDLIGLREEPWASIGSKEFFCQNISKIVNESKVIFTDSDHTKSQVIERFPKIENKIKVTHLAASPIFHTKEVDRLFLTRFGIKDVNKSYFLFVGEIQPRKNIKSMIKAFTLLPDKVKKEFNFVLIGRAKNKKYLQEILADIEKSKCQIYVLSSVSDDDLVKFYNLAHAFIYVSFYEGFGLPVIEAMSCGCPVLTSDSSSLREIAVDAAILANPYDLGSIREGMLQLIMNNDLRLQIKQLGYKRASQFSWEKTARKTVEGYNFVLDM